jgi:tRNA uridine 5-carboxymethylaminomethyl modification enzyme
MSSIKSSFKVLVVGGGHAGVEAAAAVARLGVETILVSLNSKALGQMSCNPAIGGLGKGHLVKEVDALGGIMGQAIDATGIQYRTLNTSKGPAVRASRAQADREQYSIEICRIIAEYHNIKVIEGEVAGIEVKHNKITGITLSDGTIVNANSVVITTGTFLRGLMHTGTTKTVGGRVDDKVANFLSESLKANGFNLGRLKTGTPARISKSSINFSVCQEQPGDDNPQPFSMMTEKLNRQQISCWTTTTNEATHEIIRKNKERSPMFNGQITTGGPRYCPSIEDKVFRFTDKLSHTIFLEPEGYTSDLVYPNGISTSLPQDVQDEFIRTISGLENAKIIKYGYAVEYDFVDPTCLKPTLETKNIENLYFAGQINGTSGYEEAAAQGIIAGANAALKLLNQEPLIIDRSLGYIGVMIDDLITLGVDEPYRMFTSRAEYRLTLREDNVVERICPLAFKIGLLKEKQIDKFKEITSSLYQGRSWLKNNRIILNQETANWLESIGTAPLKESMNLDIFLRRPEITLDVLLEHFHYPNVLTIREKTSLEAEIKFGGYLQRQNEEIERVSKAEKQVIPIDFPFDKIPGLRVELKEKLYRFKPYSLGHAKRIPGMTPSALSQIAIFLKNQR